MTTRPARFGVPGRPSGCGQPVENPVPDPRRPPKKTESGLASKHGCCLQLVPWSHGFRCRLVNLCAVITPGRRQHQCRSDPGRHCSKRRTRRWLNRKPRTQKLRTHHLQGARAVIVVMGTESRLDAWIAESCVNAGNNVPFVAGPFDADPGSGNADAMGLGSTRRPITSRPRVFSRSVPTVRSYGAVGRSTSAT